MEEWIERISTRNKDFGGYPACPFARKAWIENKVAVDPEVVVFTFDPKEITSEKLTEIARGMCNSEFVALEDHPDDIEVIGETVVNHGTKAVILIQRRSEIELARTKLRKEYYQNFDSEMLEDLLDR